MALSNSASLFNRLHAAAARHIAANFIGAVGKDGRYRVCIEKLKADHEIVDILRELGTAVGDHEPGCAAMQSPIMECDCPVRERIAAIRDGALPSVDHGDR